jgi:hypothetical protein
VTYDVITRIKAVLINALIGLVVTVVCSPKQERNTQWSWEDLELSSGPDRPGSNPGPAECHLSSFI